MTFNSFKFSIIRIAFSVKIKNQKISLSPHLILVVVFALNDVANTGRKVRADCKDCASMQ